GQDVYCEDIYVGVVYTNTPLRQEAKIRTFPIPVGTGPLTFEVELPEGSLASDLSLRLYNAQGQQIVEQVLNPTGPVWRIQIDMARWPRGVYLYELVGTVGVIASGRVVK
ncbi:MAG: T9SS type A sorting domain-containing protein, partial [Bacteroidota bacterium]